MEEQRKQIYTFREFPKLIEILEQRAQQEGTTRNGLICRALRIYLFSSPVAPDFEKTAEPNQNAELPVN